MEVRLRMLALGPGERLRLMIRSPR
jgi:hypothetical protein